MTIHDNPSEEKQAEMSDNRLTGAFFMIRSNLRPSSPTKGAITRTLLLGASLAALSFSHQAAAQDSAFFDIAHPNVSVDLSVLDDGGIGPATQVSPTSRGASGHIIPGSKMPVSTLYITPQGNFSAIAAPTKPVKVVTTKPKTQNAPEAKSETMAKAPPPAPAIVQAPEPPAVPVAEAPAPDPVPVAPVTKAPEPEPKKAPVVVAAKSDLPEPPEPAPVPPAPEPSVAAPEPSDVPAAPKAEVVKAEPAPAKQEKPVELDAAPKAPPAAPPPPAVVAEPAKAPTAPATTPEVTAKLPQAPDQPAEVKAESAAPEVASLAPAGPAIKDGHSLRVVFEMESSKLPGDVRNVLKELAQGMRKQDGLRLQLLAYAGGADMSSSAARRLSLSRALAIRSFLIENGVRSTRIDVRALGNKTTEAETERVDITVIER